MTASDSHRAEVLANIASILDRPIPDNEEEATALEDAIMALLDAERKRWIGEVKAALSNLYNPEITDLERNDYHNEDKPVVYVDAVSKVLEEVE